jgi:hypothetical protein
VKAYFYASDLVVADLIVDVGFLKLDYTRACPVSAMI